MTSQVGPWGLILAGGLSRRMGGGDKTLMALGGRPILAHIVERLAPQCDGLLISANGDPGRFDSVGLPVVADHPDDQGAGPLAGLLAGLDWIAERKPFAAAVLTVPSDTPFLPPDLAARFLSARRIPDEICVARSGGRPHHVVALWPIGLRHDLRRAVRTEKLRRVADILARHGVREVAWPSAPVDPFANVNTPRDLDEVRRTAADRSSS